MSEFGRYRVSVNGSTYLNPCRSRGVQHRRKVLALGDGMHQTFHTPMRSAPVFRFATLDLGTLLGLCANADFPMVSLSSTGLVAQFPKGAAAAPGWDTTAVHQQIAIATGELYIDGISGSGGDVAEAAASCFGINAAGTTHPVQESLVATPTATVPASAYVLATMTIGGNAFPQWRNYGIRIAHGAENNDEAVCYNGGAPHPSIVKKPGANGRGTVSFEAQLLDFSTAISSGTVVLVFKDKTANSFAYGANTKTVTINGQDIDDRDLEDGDPGTRSVRIAARFDGTNRPITVS